MLESAPQIIDVVAMQTAVIGLTIPRGKIHN